MKRASITLLAMAALTAVVVWVFLAKQAVKADNGSVVGSWINTITVNTPPGAPPLIFPELVTINPGGTFIDTLAIAHSSQNPFFAGPPFAPLAVDFSDAIGTWRPAADANQIAFTFKRFPFCGRQHSHVSLRLVLPGAERRHGHH